MKTIKDIQNEVAVVERYLDELAQGNEISTDGTRLVDARGCTLNQILYFVYRGRPVVAYLGNGGYGLIYGYDQYNISCLWFPGTEYAYFDKMGLNDAAAFLRITAEMISSVSCPQSKNDETFTNPDDMV